MTKRGWLTASLSFFVGITVGAGIMSQRLKQSPQKKTAEIFSRRLRCKDLANRYSKEQTKDTQIVRLDIVDYSEVSNSCIASFEGWDQLSPQYAVQTWSVVDVLSGQTLYQGSCQPESDCGNGKNMMLMRRSEAAFHQAVKGQPVDIEKVQ